jgi:hypothetical protein
LDWPSLIFQKPIPCVGFYDDSEFLLCKLSLELVLKFRPDLNGNNLDFSWPKLSASSKLAADDVFRGETPPI